MRLIMIFEEKDVPGCLGRHYGGANVHLSLLFSNEIFIAFTHSSMCMREPLLRFVLLFRCKAWLVLRQQCSHFLASDWLRGLARDPLLANEVCRDICWHLGRIFLFFQ